jgi:hypothetical protein
LYWQTGNAFGQLSAVKAYNNGISPANLFNLPGFFSSLINVNPAHDYGHSPIDRLFFIWLLGCLPSIYKRDKTWFAYSIAAGVLPAIVTVFISFSRYFLMAFPVVVCAAIYFSEPKRTPTLYIVLASLMILQVYFLVMHFNYYWAG